MRYLFYSTISLTSLFAWAGGISPLVTQDIEKLSFVGMISAAMIVVALLIFRTSKFDALIMDSALSSNAARFHRAVFLAISFLTIVFVALVLYRMSLHQLQNWQNALLFPFALFFFNSAGWLMKRPTFAGGSRRSRKP